MASKAQITRGLSEIGAAWAVTSAKTVLPEDRPDPNGRVRPTYHIHPDRTYPHQNSIISFERLADIAAYIEARKEAASLDDGTDAGLEAAINCMEVFWGNLQS